MGIIWYKEWIIIFGGCVSKGKYTDSIYVLNIKDSDEKAEWSLLSYLNCPIENKYHAILMPNCDGGSDDVHLFTMPNRNGHKPGHYSISIQAILANQM